MKPIVTLTTDFGIGDPEIGSLYGTIWKLAPSARVIDLTHNIERHNVMQAALSLESDIPYFPRGSIHVVVVDPGVGTNRRPLAVRLGTQYIICPDNGVITRVYRRSQSRRNGSKFIHLNQSQYWLPDVSPIFHGRDIFAAAAGHLAAGTPLKSMGNPIEDPILLDIPEPRRIQGGWQGQVTFADHFGNLATNVPRKLLRGRMDVKIYANQQQVVDGLVHTFGERKPGNVVALIDSSDYLSICVVNGSAAERLNLRAGDSFDVIFNRG